MTQPEDSAPAAEGTAGDPDDDLYAEAASLLAPGEATYRGVVLHTTMAQHAEQAMNKLMRAAGDRITEHVADAETYVYAGEDDERFGVGQFQGRRLADDEPIWECQQLLREGTFDLVFYWNADRVAADSSGAEGASDPEAVHEVIVADLADLDADVVPVTEDGAISLR